jgi:hypothetical protein
MMPTLLEKAESVREGLARVRLANQARQQIATLQQRSQEWNRVTKRRTELLARWRTLTESSPLPEEEQEASAAVSALALQAHERLNTRDVQALTEEALWERLLKSASAANDQLENESIAFWRNVIDEYGEVATPQVLANRAVRTPANDAALATYRASYDTFKRLVAQKIPTDPTPTKLLRAVVESMHSAREGLTLSAPEEVRAFLSAVDAGGAQLSLLTPSVIGWLAEHDDPQRFTIKLRGSTAWR